MKNRVIRLGKELGKPGPRESGDQIRELTKLWLEGFQLAVNLKDYELGCRLFSPRVYSFGTVAPIAKGLEELVKRQWEKRWPNIVEFSFDIDVSKMIVSPPHVICVTTWASQNVDKTELSGRATLVLQGQRMDDGPVELRCVHSHFSISP